MAADNPIPLATVADLSTGGFADLTRSFADTALADFMIQATRACETECQRRLTPFTGLTESHRAEGVDPDEYAGTSLMPLDLVGALGRSRAAAYGSTDSMVRHCWLNEYAPLYSDMWTYSNVSIEVVLSVGGTLTVTGSITGPESDSGHVWFNAGTYIPVGSLIRPTYSGGYTKSVPRDLNRACQYMAAAIAARELDPMQHPGHDPSQLEAVAVAWLSPYART